MRSNGGNVLFLILIAVALFAALSYAVTSTSRSGESGVSKDKAKIAAAQIVQYATQVEQAISRLRVINKCSDTQISFERTPFDGSDTDYVNPNAPADFRCHVFHPDGGGIPYVTIDTAWLDQSQSAEALYGAYFFTAATCVADVGSGDAGCHVDGDDTNEELIMFFPFLQNIICNEIAKKTVLSGAGKIPTDYNNLWMANRPFNGAYQGARVILNSAAPDNSGTLRQKRNGCLEGGGSPAFGTYHYYHVLIAR